MSLVSGVPSCLYESPPPLDEWGDGGLNVESRACAMVVFVMADLLACRKLAGGACGMRQTWMGPDKEMRKMNVILAGGSEVIEEREGWQSKIDWREGISERTLQKEIFRLYWEGMSDDQKVASAFLRQETEMEGGGRLPHESSCDP